MVHDLTLKSVRLKTTIFNPPAKLINYKELSCAIGIAYRQAGLELPVSETGRDVAELCQEALKAWGDSPRVNDSVKFVIEHYTFNPEREVMDEDSEITMRLGYDAG